MNLYVIRNRDGEFFRAKGYGGRGETWVADLAKAKFYAKLGPARSCVTYFAREGPEYGVPDILEFALDTADAKVIDMTAYAEKSVGRIKRRKLEVQRAHNEWELKELLRKQEEINTRLSQLKPK